MIQILCALLIIAGLFLLFNIHPKGKPFQRLAEKKQRIRRITNKPKGRFQRTVDNAKEMLLASGMGEQINTYKWIAVIMAIMGLLVGLSFNNLPAALVLAAGLGCSPLVIIRVRTADYLRNLHERLESAMSTLTNSYISSCDLVGAVGSTLHLIPAPVDGILKQFLIQTQLVEADVVKAIRQMRDRIGNRYWNDWCDVLIQCHHDRQLRFSLPGIVERLGEMRRLQIETDTLIRKQISDYVITVLIVLGSIPLMGGLMPDWYAMLMNTPVGKLTLAVILAAILATAIWVARLYRPVEGGKLK